ncbi:MAG TPA: hypothetical protein VF171_06670 [Trueperaceae bacterium]
MHTVYRYGAQLRSGMWELAAGNRLEEGRLLTHLLRLHRFHQQRRWERPGAAQGAPQGSL